MTLPNVSASDSDLARSLARLWPHRWHESSVWKNVLCFIGLHRWAKLDLTTLVPDRDVSFCRWCDRITIDGESVDS